MTPDELRKIDPEFRLADGPYRRQVLYRSIEIGDSVTIETPHGQLRSGVVRIRGPRGVVLNGGGAHGTPLVASEDNVVSVRRAGARKPLQVLRAAKYEPLSKWERKDLEDKSQAFYWSAHMNCDRLEDPTKSAKALSRLLHDDIMTGKRTTVGQRPFAAAHATDGIPAHKWLEQVRKAQAHGYPIEPAVIAEADTMEAGAKARRVRV